jgi:hypothetical protein
MCTNQHNYLFEYSLLLLIPVIILIINLFFNKFLESYKQKRKLWISWSVVISLFWMFIIYIEVISIVYMC